MEGETLRANEASASKRPRPPTTVLAPPGALPTWDDQRSIVLRDDVATQFAEERGCNRKDELGACVYDRERGFKASKPTDPSVVVTVASLDASLTPQLLVLTNCKRAAVALEGKLFTIQM